jgi:deazaflavin-dependent oxidoreductase (nitroreductase family)
MSIFARVRSARPAVDLADKLLSSRRTARAPIAVYRAGLGFLFGSRMLMLEHTGRKTGARRYVVVEVIDHPAPDVYVVPSGFGERAQWYRNVTADPDVRITTGFRRSVPARARRLGSADAGRVLQTYTARHPRAWATLKGVIERSLGHSVSTHQTELPMIELRVT